MDSSVEHKERQTAAGKVDGSARSLSHLINKRDVISNNSTPRPVRRNIVSSGGKMVIRNVISTNDDNETFYPYSFSPTLGQSILILQAILSHQLGAIVISTD